MKVLYFGDIYANTAICEHVKAPVTDVDFSAFFYKKKSRSQIFRYCWFAGTEWYPMVSETFRVLYAWFLALRSEYGVFGTALAAKNMDFQSRITDIPNLGPRSDWSRIWEENQWFSTARRNSVGNWWSNSTETIQKLHFWAYKSFPEHSRGCTSQIRHQIRWFCLKSTSPTSALSRTPT